MINLHFYNHFKIFSFHKTAKLFTYVAMVGQTSDLKIISLSFPIAVIACVDQIAWKDYLTHGYVKYYIS